MIPPAVGGGLGRGPVGGEGTGSRGRGPAGSGAAGSSSAAGGRGPASGGGSSGRRPGGGPGSGPGGGGGPIGGGAHHQEVVEPLEVSQWCNWLRPSHNSPNTIGWPSLNFLVNPTRTLLISDKKHWTIWKTPRFSLLTDPEGLECALLGKPETGTTR